jgi:hypothetical protein
MEAWPMRRQSWLIAGVLGIAAAGFAVWSLSSGQEGLPPVPGVSPPPSSTPRDKTPEPDPGKLNVQVSQAHISAQRGADWLKRANRSDGRFVYGFYPALSRPMEGDDYLGQAGATLTLARVARVLKDKKAEEFAQHTLIVLLIDTVVSPTAPDVRSPTLPSALVNRLAAAGMLAAAIYELPNPTKELSADADRLCNYIRGQQQANGSLQWADTLEAAPFVAEGTALFPGPALYAVARSHAVRPAPWKIDLVRKARSHYMAWWREHKNPTFVAWHAAAYAEAYAATKEQAFADAVFELVDWLCTLQYQEIDPRRPLWKGGFMGWQDGKAALTAPTIQTAAFAGSLVEACRAARQAGDVVRLSKYREGLAAALQFVTTLQYTEVNTRHFANWYKEEVLLGGFHASHQDGNLRLDYTQHAVAALAHYVEHVAEPR